MHRMNRVRRISREWLAAALGIAALCLAALVYVRSYRPPVHRLIITAGSPEGLRHQIAARLATEARKRRVELRVVGTSGSEEALDRVEKGEIDLALVQGGLGMEGRTRLRQVAALNVEPLHLLVKEELHAEVSRGLDALRGKRINLSEVGSGTSRLALAVLAFVGLNPESTNGAGDYRVSNLGYRQLQRESDRRKLPDAAFMVSALPSPVARHLVSKQGYRLVPITFGEAFALDILNAELPPNGGKAWAAGLERTHLVLTEIPPFTYGVAPAVPPIPVATIGTRMLMVARSDVDASAVVRILETIFSPEFASMARPPLDAGLLAPPPELPWHPGTLDFVERSKPLIAGDAIDSLEKALSIAGALLGGLFFLWQWWRQWHRRKQERGFEAYMLKVTAVERQALQLEVGAMLDLKELLRLQMELSQLKGEALEKLAEGELEGKELVSGFISHVNDARNYLARLILHERDNLEDFALRQDRSPEAVWNEALGEIPAIAAPTQLGPVTVEDLGP
jgi:TRAP-type uncharacterized transport system substrate-binding protein